MSRPKILAYYFPDWHADPRNDVWFGRNWTEWELLRAAKPRFDGHRQPRVPALGELDEANPRDAAVQIALANNYGVDGFLVDFYWYRDGRYLNGALDNGLLRAENARDVEFALMWANHQLRDNFPSHDPTTLDAPLLLDGAIDREAFDRMVDHVIEHYFSQENYLKVDGKPWFSIYEIGNLLEGLGGIEGTADALASFRDRCIEAGHAGLHLDAVVWGFGVLPAAVMIDDPAKALLQLDFASASSYVWVHHADVDDFDLKHADIALLRDTAFAEYEKYAESLPVPFHPNVTVGWDPSPRTDQALEYVRGEYPWMPIWDPTPAEFEAGLRRAAEFVEAHAVEHPVITVNAWNEWTEGSSLLPDTHHGLGFLEAVRRVFGAGDDGR